MTTSKAPNMTDYEAERRAFSLEVPEYFNFATDIVDKWAQDPHKLGQLPVFVFQYANSPAIAAGPAE